MSSVINTNIASLNAQRNLMTSQTSLQTSIQRLSSGLRINSARDDAAGLAISDRMTSQINGMTQATRNANDGVSMSQTAEGALSSSGDILQRIRQLAVQSSNASNTSSDRQALQTEVTQLGSELNRIASTTSFNGQNLLDGTMGTATFQVGANAGQTIQASGANFLTNVYGNNELQSDQVAVGAATKVVAAKTLTINGSVGTATVTTAATDTAKTITANINAATGSTGVTATANTNASLSLAANNNYQFTLKSDNATAVTISFSTGATVASATDFASGIAAINAQTANTGVIAQYDQKNNSIKLTNANGNDISLANTSAAGNTTFGVDSYKADGVTTLGTAFDMKAAAATSVVNGNITLDSATSFSMTDAGSGLALSALGTGSKLQAVSTIDITSYTGAQTAIKIADAALAAVDKQRAQYGALENRFSSTISNLASSNENLSASRSRITDTDFAAETANMTRSQILQQAGTSMLAQANSLPNGVLSLLRG
ncbi:flagellin [Massilia sp. TW-1]|uniref:Flagellin n=1 Tax=Telluria antibiotica TaxID=2717319 RepID=A0ABX0PAQ9_9BURK|nr:flagellin [Telluria antibiotica]NIA53638.1 flagellin [Telluria antibiotica]